MLRRKISAGLLRASASSTSTAVPTLPASPIQLQASGLASAVLLDTQQNWGKETVASLKNELKKRGLSQTGKKTALVDRLNSADTSAMLPPVPPMPSFAIRSAPSSPSRIRTITTTASRSFPSKTAVAPEQPKKPVEPIHDDHVSSTGPAVISQRSEAAKVAPVTAQETAIAPGLPQTRGPEKTSGKMLGVQMPNPRAESEVEQVIPFMPDNFQSNRSLSSAPTKTVEEPSLPKVLTVASASTHPAGGPLHGLHGHSDAHTHEVSSEEQPPAPPPSFGAAMNNVFSAPSRVWKASGSGLSGSLPEVGMSKSDRAEYKQPEKGLNDEEKRGLWVLAGIVGLGLLFGGPGRGKKEGMEGKEGKGRTAKHG